MIIILVDLLPEEVSDYLSHRTYSLEKASRSNATLTLMNRRQWNITKLHSLVSVSKVESAHSGYPRRTRANISAIRTTRKFMRDLHLHITVNASVSPSLSAHTGDPGIYLSVVLLIVRGSVVTCVLDSREAPESYSEDNENCHDNTKGGRHFIAHVEV